MTRLKKVIILAGDILILYISLAVMVLVRYGVTAFPERMLQHLLPFSLIFPVWLVVFYMAGLYRLKIHLESELLQAIFRAVVISGAASVIPFYLWSNFLQVTPKTNLLLFAVIFLALNYAWRSVILKILTARPLHVIVLGQSRFMDETLAVLQADNTEYRVVRWVKDFEKNDIDKLSRTIRDTKLHLAVIQPHLKNDITTMRLIYRLLPLKIVIMSFYDFYEMVFQKIPLDELKESWFIENIAVRKLVYDVLKRILDVLTAAGAGIVLLPLVPVISVLIRLSSKGPVIYRQQRVGENGRAFTLYKFRTMHHNSQGPYWTEPEDERVTLVGKYLRFIHLDEIPQLFNILRGDLSLIGPRPERLELAEQYKNLPYYRMRHLVKPGLTGWAQIHYRPSSSLEEAYEKLRYDIYYVKNRTLFLDLSIFLKTVKYLLSKRF